MSSIAALEAMSVNWYIEQAKDKGTLCPSCRFDAVNDESLNQVTDTEIDVDRSCPHCGCTWTEEYHLTTYNELTYEKEK